MKATPASGTGFDATGELSWRIFVTAILLSFFVKIEPALTDMVFFVALGVFCLSRTPKVAFLSGAAILGVFLYCFFSVLSLHFVQYVPMAALRAVLIEFYMAALFVLTAYYVKTRGDDAFFAILCALTVGAVLASFVTIVALLDLVPNSDIFFRGEGLRNRVKSTFKDPNVFGPFLVPCILFTAWVIVSAPRFRALGLAVMGLLLLSLITTYSRGAWAHALLSIGLLFIALTIHRSTARPTFTVFVWLVIAILATVLLFLDEITARLANSFFAQRLSLQSYDETRFAYVADAAQQIWDHPLGIGPYQARFVYGYLPHNTFVVFAMHNGIFACLGLILIFGSSMTRCAAKVLAQRPGWTKYALILSVLTGLLGLTMVVGAIHWRHLYLVCGMAFGSYHSDRLLPAWLATTGPLWQRRRGLQPRKALS